MDDQDIAALRNTYQAYRDVKRKHRKNTLAQTALILGGLSAIGGSILTFEETNELLDGSLPAADPRISGALGVLGIGALATSMYIGDYRGSRLKKRKRDLGSRLSEYKKIDISEITDRRNEIDAVLKGYGEGIEPTKSERNIDLGSHLLLLESLAFTEIESAYSEDSLDAVENDYPGLSIAPEDVRRYGNGIEKGAYGLALGEQLDIYVGEQEFVRYSAEKLGLADIGTSLDQLSWRNTPEVLSD